MRAYALALMLALTCPAWALEFRSVSDAAVVLYDGPSAKSTKIAILTRDYPLEIVSQIGGWAKVRDNAGQLAWVEAKSLTAKRTALVTVALAEVRQEADAQAPIVFWAEQNVVLELVDENFSAWVKVRHRDGLSGFIRADQVWGL